MQYMEDVQNLSSGIMNIKLYNFLRETYNSKSGMFLNKQQCYILANTEPHLIAMKIAEYLNKNKSKLLKHKS